MKISILLPYKENYSKDYAGAVSIFVSGINRYSKYRNNIKVYGNTDYANLLSKNYINQTLIELFDLKNIVWLPGGLDEDDTDGHIDNIFAPIGNNKYLLASSKLEDKKNYDILKNNKKALEQFFLSQNINAEIIQVPLPSEIIIENKRLVASYINFYFSKKSIFIPKFNVKEDEEVYDIFKSLFRDKNIKMIETKNINYGGGNIHCVTMNVPKI